MTEQDLSHYINKLAEKEAEGFIVQIYSKVRSALEKQFWPSELGRHWAGEDIKQVLLNYASSIGTSKDPTLPKPSNKLVEQFRLKILNNFLNATSVTQKLLAIEAEFKENTCED